MLFRQIPALLFLLLAASALAAPKPKTKNKHGYGQPTAHCEVEKSKNGVRDIYSLRGNNWNVTSAQLKAGLETPGTVVTGWEFKEAINVDDVHTFKAKFKLPINEKKATQKKLEGLVKPYKLKVRCK